MERELHLQSINYVLYIWFPYIVKMTVFANRITACVDIITKEIRFIKDHTVVSYPKL